MTNEAAVRSHTPFVAALATAILGLLLLGVYVRRLRVEISGGAPVALLALREDLPAGSLLQERHLVTHEVPENYVESRQVRASEIPRVVGIATAVSLEANHTLSWTDLVSTTRDDRILSDHVPPGMRAISVPSLGGFMRGSLLRPGDRVDVLVTNPGKEGRAVTIPLLQNVLVLSVGSQLSITEGVVDSASTPVTLLVTVDQASLLVHAKKDSRVDLVLRNPNDLEVNEGLPDTYDSDILQQERRERRQHRLVLERVD